MSFPLLSTIFGLPLLAALILFFIPADRQRAIKLVSLGAASAAFGLALVLFAAYDRGRGGLQFVERLPWLSLLGINYFLGVNGINIALVLLTGLIITAGVLASWELTHRVKEFFILLLTLTAGVFGVFLAYNLFLFFLFYELAVLPMYLLIGIWGTGRKEYAAMKLTLYLMAGSALILAGILGLYFAVAQKDLKYIVAYSSVSHMGIVLLGLASMNEIAINGAVLQMFSHGAMTGLFFALVGMIYGRSHTRMVDEQGGLARKMPVLAVFFALAGLTSLGLPGLSGFPAELAVFLGAFRAYPLPTLVSVTGLAITAFYVLRVVQRLFFGSLHLKREAALTDANRVELTALTILAIFVVAVGLYPLPIMRLIGSGVAPIAARLGGM